MISDDDVEATVCRRLVQPMDIVDTGFGRIHERMLTVRDNDDSIESAIFSRDIPSLSIFRHVDAMALSDRITIEAVVFADDISFRVDNVARGRRVAHAEKLFEIELPNKTDALRVRLCSDGEISLFRHASNFRLLKIADREITFRKRLRRNTMQEVGLVFCWIDRDEEMMAVVVSYASVVTGSDAVEAELEGCFKK